jgi:hypothetical protein
MTKSQAKVTQTLGKGWVKPFVALGVLVLVFYAISVNATNRAKATEEPK